MLAVHRPVFTPQAEMDPPIAIAAPGSGNLLDPLSKPAGSRDTDTVRVISRGIEFTTFPAHNDPVKRPLVTLL